MAAVFGILGYRVSKPSWGQFSPVKWKLPRHIRAHFHSRSVAEEVPKQVSWCYEKQIGYLGRYIYYCEILTSWDWLRRAKGRHVEVDSISKTPCRHISSCKFAIWLSRYWYENFATLGQRLLEENYPSLIRQHIHILEPFSLLKRGFICHNAQFTIHLLRVGYATIQVLQEFAASLKLPVSNKECTWVPTACA